MIQVIRRLLLVLIWASIIVSGGMTSFYAVSVIGVTDDLSSVEAVILLAIGGAFMGSASAASLRSVNPLALDCFRFERIASCEQALIRSEQLQRSASARDRYPCQTMLLGLQSDLVMVQLRAGRGKDAVNFLTAVNVQCQGF